MKIFMRNYLQTQPGWHLLNRFKLIEGTRLTSSNSLCLRLTLAETNQNIVQELTVLPKPVRRPVYFLLL